MKLKIFWFIICSYVLICLRKQFCESAVFFPSNSAYGIFAAIAVPLDLPHRNVFLSYNFEANYNLPSTWSVPPVLNGIQEEDGIESSARQMYKCANCTSNDGMVNSIKADDEEEYDSVSTTTTNENETTDDPTINPRINRKKDQFQRSLLSRTHFYHILMDKMKRSGYPGKECLLRLICETNASELGDINGVLGNLIHIIFSPSTSMYEELPLPYYQAEIDGIHDQCDHYSSKCKTNLLDLISKPLIDILQSLMSNK